MCCVATALKQGAHSLSWYLQERRPLEAEEPQRGLEPWSKWFVVMWDLYPGCRLHSYTEEMWCRRDQWTGLSGRQDNILTIQSMSGNFPNTNRLRWLTFFFAHGMQSIQLAFLIRMWCPYAPPTGDELGPSGTTSCAAIRMALSHGITELTDSLLPFFFLNHQRLD